MKRNTQTFYQSKTTTLIALLILLGTVAPLASKAATNLVKIRAPFTFDPTNITINMGDTIKWTNMDTQVHDSTHKNTNGQARLWTSGTLSNRPPNNTFAFTFANTGKYPYFCSIHLLSHPEQTGTVAVVTAPIISLGSAKRLS